MLTAITKLSMGTIEDPKLKKDKQKKISFKLSTFKFVFFMCLEHFSLVKGALLSLIFVTVSDVGVVGVIVVVRNI